MVGTKHQNSRMTWGGYDALKYVNTGSDFRFHQVNSSSSFWQMTLDTITLSDTVNPLADSQYKFGNESKLIIDSGTSFTMVPKKERTKF